MKKYAKKVRKNLQIRFFFCNFARFLSLMDECALTEGMKLFTK